MLSFTILGYVLIFPLELLLEVELPSARYTLTIHVGCQVNRASSLTTDLTYHQHPTKTPQKGWVTLESNPLLQQGKAQYKGTEAGNTSILGPACHLSKTATPK